MLVIQAQLEDGTPLEGVCLDLSGPAPYSVCDNGEEDADPTGGAIELDGVVAGDYALTVRAPEGYELAGDLPAPLRVEPEQMVPLTLTFRSVQVATPTVEVVETPGFAIFQMTLEDGTSPVTGVCLELTGPARYAVCDGGDLDADPTDGTVELDDVAAGDYALTVTSPEGYEPVTIVETVQVPAGDFAQVLLTFRPVAAPPTEAPTATETTVPTEEPTAEATEAPTEEPTATPTEEPTPEPPADGVLIVQVFLEDGATPLGDACFSITGPASYETCDNGEDDADPTAGTFEIDGVPAGDYTIAATPPEGYEPVGDQPAEFRIEPGQLAALTFTYRPVAVATPTEEPTLGTLIITKVDAADGTTPLPGACFAVTGSDGAGSELCDDDGDGVVRFENLSPGDYTVQETRAPEGYLPGIEQTVAVPPGGESALTFADEAVPSTGTLTVVTLDPDGAPAPGACYEATGPDGATAQGCDDDGDGAVPFGDVVAGDWVVRQTTTAPGFDPSDPAEQTVTVEAGQPAEVRFTVRPAAPTTGTLIVTKVDAVDGTTPLPGACFTATGPDGTSTELCDDDGDGVVRFEGLVPGDWQVQETRAPEGYAPVSEEPVVVTVPEGGEAPVTIANQAVSPEPGTLAAIARDPDDRSLPGACYVATGPNGAAVDGCDDDGDGTADLGTVPPGEWTVIQTSPPPGYDPTDPAEQPVVVESGQTAEARFEHRPTDPAQRQLPPPLPKPASVTLVGDFQDELGCPQDFDATCPNTALTENHGVWTGVFPIPPGTYTFRIVAVSDVERSLGRGANPDGGDLSLTVPDGTAAVYVEYDAGTGRIIASPRPVQAQVVTDTGVFPLRPVEHGRFEGYFDATAGTLNVQIQLNGETTAEDSFELDRDSRIHVVVETDGAIAIVEAVESASLVVTRTDAGGAPVAGSCFAVVAADGALIGQACDADDGNFDGVTTIAFPNGVRGGTATLKETRAPEGFAPAPDQPVDLVSGDNQAQVIA